MEAASGVVGRITGAVMARLTAEANHWVVELLDVGRQDRVLDVGCGPGVAVAAAAAAAPEGVVAGVDGSAEMVRQARRRNRLAIGKGRVSIHHADAAALPFADGRFTRAATVNSLQFWPSPAAALGDMHRVLRPGGRVAVVLMGRSDDLPASDTGPPPWLDDVGLTMQSVGFHDIDWRRRDFGGVPHWALLAGS
jgi:ubiquinone/menaquinone biosynthesis C-methylase UbiE